MIPQTRALLSERAQRVGAAMRTLLIDDDDSFAFNLFHLLGEVNGTADLGIVVRTRRARRDAAEGARGARGGRGHGRARARGRAQITVLDLAARQTGWGATSGVRSRMSGAARSANGISAWICCPVLCAGLRSSWVRGVRDLPNAPMR
jgi:hypothetical protein